MSDEYTAETLAEWHDVPTFGGLYRERFDAAALEGVTVTIPFRFKVIRETWDETVEPPTRVIHEIEVMS